MKVIKRNGKEVDYDSYKIYVAISKANNETNELSDDEVKNIASEVDIKCKKFDRALNVEEIQDIVENTLMNRNNALKTAKKYITYRYQRMIARKGNTTDAKILSLIKSDNEEVKQENANKNSAILSTQRDYIAGEVSKDLSKRYLLPEHIYKAHEEGMIHIHDLDYYCQPMTNCCLINLEDMLQNGTNISGVMIEKPHSFLTACTIASQISASVASSQFGGQSITLSHLAPFVDVSRKKIYQSVKEELKDLNLPNEKLLEITEKRLRKEIQSGIQTLQYQVITLNSTNGQSPFITVFMYLNEVSDERTKNDLALIIEETLKQRIIGVKNKDGVYITPAFPKLIYVLEEDNINEDSKYFYLTELAAKCSAKRMVPDYISEKKMKDLKNGNCFPTMGCRSILSTWYDENHKPKFYGRFNKGVTTINLIDVACSSIGDNYHKDLNSFWHIFDERLELCHESLICRYKKLVGTPSDVAPILWQNGALARLKQGEAIDKLLVGGYSSISLGYAGLWECVYELIGSKLTEEKGKKLGLKIMKFMNEKCDKWNEELNLGFGIYGTPLESTTYEFAKCLQKRFGIIKGVTDKSYVTNSYHVHVTEPIDAFIKLKNESEFQKLSTGGAISYIEVPNMQNNISAIISVLKFIYNNIMYAELNTKSDYCQECGFTGEIQIVKINDKMHWRCPKCGNTNHNKMNTARRICGYIGTNDCNQGRLTEIAERVLHL